MVNAPSEIPSQIHQVFAATLKMSVIRRCLMKRNSFSINRFNFDLIIEINTDQKRSL